MMVTIDNLAHRYGLLPSEVISRADTFDLEVLGISVQWELYKQRKAGGKNAPKPVPDLSQKDLLNIVEHVKKQKKKK